MLLQCEELAVIDNLSGKLYLIVYADPPSPRPTHAPSSACVRSKSSSNTRSARPRSKPAKATRRSAALPNKTTWRPCKAKDLIAAGDFMQVQVGQRIHKRYTESPLSLYRALRSLNPSPYMYYYHFGDFQVVGASRKFWCAKSTPKRAPKSPSAHWRARAHAVPRPRKTRRSSWNWINDPKERAEHVMLIDLARNDIGRIAKIGSVKVTEAFVVERYSHVMHIVSNVEGILNEGMSSMDVLRATFRRARSPVRPKSMPWS